MIAPTPSSRAARATFAARSGDRWAEATVTRQVTSSPAKVSTAGLTTGRSFSLPITINTLRFISKVEQADARVQQVIEKNA